MCGIKGKQLYKRAEYVLAFAKVVHERVSSCYLSSVEVVVICFYILIIFNSKSEIFRFAK